MFRTLSLFACILLAAISAHAQWRIAGLVKNDRGPVSAASLILNNKLFTSTDQSGLFSFDRLPAGQYQLIVSSIGYRADTVNILLKDKDEDLMITLTPVGNRLDTVTVNALPQKTAFTRLKDVEGTAIYAGKKSEVIILRDFVANKSTNNTRQVYAKVAGLNIWENDAAGLQLAIGGRGLNPNRTANFNTRQNGYDISADALGYPESYYTPPAEAVDRIEMVRGAASLQYGTQFGGMINFSMVRGSDTEKIGITTRLTGGSFNFLNSSTTIGGSAGKFNYVAFYQHKSGNSWRPNSDFFSNTIYLGTTYQIRSNMAVTLQYTHMDYLQHQPGGLTDQDFNADPHQSIRARNWFRVNWDLGAMLFDYQITPKLHFNNRLFGLSAARNALGILTFINRPDDAVSDRNLYIDHYRNWGNESRLLYQYNLGHYASTALAGWRYYNGHTNRQQGFGNNGREGRKDDFAFTPTNPLDSLRYSAYVFPEHNLALFAENIFRLSNRLNLIPGLRYEQISTRADGTYSNVVFDGAGNPIIPLNGQLSKNDRKSNERSFLIAGLGLTYALRSNIQIYGNVSQNYKAINFNDIRSLTVQVDTALKDEKGFSADLGIRKSTGLLHYDVSAFLVNYDDKIGNILDTVTALTTRTNIGQSIHAGVESYVEADIWKWLKGTQSNTSLAFFSNLSWLSAKYTHGKDKAINGRGVEFVPKVIFKTGVTFRRKKLSASYQFSYTSSQYSDATNAKSSANALVGIVPAYAIMDLSAEYIFNRRWSLSASLNNLANQAYFTRRADSYPGPGIVPADARSFYLTLQFHL